MSATRVPFRRRRGPEHHWSSAVSRDADGVAILTAMWVDGRRAPKPKRRDTDHVPAAVAMMAKEREDRPFGSTGEFLAPPPSAPPRPAREPFVIEPWPEEERRKAMRRETEPPPKPLNGALAELKARHGDDFPELRLDPPETVAPLHPVSIPPPDWRDEDRERNRKPRPLDEPPKSLQTRPA
jgi:hypothetical protein